MVIANDWWPMQNQDLLALTSAQRDRLAYIDLRLRFIGEVRRADLVSRFGIQTAAATRDLAQYKELAPGNLEYDSKGKVYIPSARIRPIFEFTADRVLTWLTQGYGDGEPTICKGLLPHGGVAQATNINLDLLAVITRAISGGAAIEVNYRELADGLTSREIVPFALTNNGQRWLVRAFDRRGTEFRDFALGRFDDARAVHGSFSESERHQQDIQWNRITELELVPHPANVRHPDTIEAEHGMVNGVLRMKVRASMAAYLLDLWKVDCTKDHSLKGEHYHLWLRNRQALYAIANTALAPGYETPEQEGH